MRGFTRLMLGGRRKIKGYEKVFYGFYNRLMFTLFASNRGVVLTF